MKRIIILLFIILISSFCIAQVDKPITITGGFAVLEQGKLWNNTTPTNYLFKPPPYSTFQVYITSFSGTPPGFSVSLFETADPTVNGFSSSTCGVNGTTSCSLFYVGATGTTQTPYGNCNTPLNNTTIVCQFVVKNPQLVALQFASNGSPSLIRNYNMTLSISPNQATANPMYGTGIPFNGNKPFYQIPVIVDTNGGLSVSDCARGGVNTLAFNASASNIYSRINKTIAAGTTANVFSGNGSQDSICNITIGISANGTYQFTSGTKTATDCDTGTILLSPAMNLNTGSQVVIGNGNSIVIQAPVGDVCISAVTGNVTVFGAGIQ